MVDQKILDEFTDGSRALAILRKKTAHDYDSPYRLMLANGRAYVSPHGATEEEAVKHFLDAVVASGTTLNYDELEGVFTGEDLLRVILESFKPEAQSAAMKGIGWEDSSSAEPRSFKELKFLYEQGLFYTIDSLGPSSTGGESIAHLKKLAKLAWEKFPAETTSYLKADLPWWFTYNSDDESSVELTEKGEYPSGVFLLATKTRVEAHGLAPYGSSLNSKFETGAMFNSVLLECIIKKSNYFSVNSPYACLNANVIPAGLLDGTTAVFVPTEDPRSAAVFLAPKLDEIGPKGQFVISLADEAALIEQTHKAMSEAVDAYLVSLLPPAETLDVPDEDNVSLDSSSEKKTEKASKTLSSKKKDKKSKQSNKKSSKKEKKASKESSKKSKKKLSKKLKQSKKKKK